MRLLRWLARTHVLGLSVSVGITLALFTWLFDGAERDQRSQFEQRLLLLQANTLAKTLANAPPEVRVGGPGRRHGSARLDQA